ncbi:MAG: hypothetical protein C5B56_03785 [Proteobacteria bacterium]|nr:MAG: hypothetical protein C5B56_03785 [Pseudomonadota bacterium]
MVCNDPPLNPNPNSTSKDKDRREKFRFPMNREVRYKVLQGGGATLEAGQGQTIDMSSGGVLFQVERDLTVGAFIQLSVSWPVLLDDSCPMRLVIFGRVLRSTGNKCACSIDKHEFRTQARVIQPPAMRTDSSLERWAGTFRKEQSKLRLVTV